MLEATEAIVAVKNIETPDEWHAFLGGVRSGEFDRFAEAAATGPTG